MPVVFTGRRGRRLRLEVFFAACRRGKGTMPTVYASRSRASRPVWSMRTARRSTQPRSLRHFFASRALAKGVPIHEVSRWLGHRSVKTTIDIYGHLLPRTWERLRVVGPAERHAARPFRHSAQPLKEASWSTCTQAA